MFYPYYKDADKFMPDTKSMRLWLGTRKNGSVNKPGIFETIDYTKDQIWSFVSIIIEVLALYFTFQGAYKSFVQTGNIGIVWIALITVIFFVAFDIIGIMLHGQDKPKRTIDKARFIVESDPLVRKQIFERMNETTMREFFGILLLSISAFLKIAALWYFFQLSNIQILIVFTLLYLIVIYIHSVHTVYWWPALILKNRIKRQYRKWKVLNDMNLPTTSENTITNNDIIQQPFESSSSILQNSISTCTNERIKITCQGQGKYLLEAKGPLWDENIVNLCSQWGNNGIEDLLNNCIKVQLLQCGVIITNNNNNINTNNQ
jgi:hypothetical protein